ncbi:hypothetical protein [Fodinibius salsisoli]|uniref:GDSL-like Lipase/Acylhydrolase n=1 Tax=Fodinibius salsisoli TaxID=2820877 RepID=A0ABT3PMJ3_9BACT|nr:hypothetical protein [Fodinibius salsisoli]MCW9707080.1 hypothetical protein [Fodinibius salsisoli]
MKEHVSPKHKLVVLGDSIGQGFQNGGIYRTDLNFPAFLAQCFEPEPEFNQPVFTAQGGIPLNLEVLTRGLSDQYGDSLEWTEYIPAATHLYKTLRRIKKYWEGKYKSLAIESQKRPFHNQSVWGFAANDAWLLTDAKSRYLIENYPESYSIFDVLPDHAMYTTASIVLNPAQQKQHLDSTLFDNVMTLQEDGGIENLIVTMGHNNIIGAVTDLRFKYSEPDDLGALPSDRDYTVYRPEHFEQEYRKLASKVNDIGAERVFVPTIPYVTIPPVSRGVNEDRSDPVQGYFDYYTRFWIWDSDFDPGKHPHLTKEEAIQLDKTVDEYNRSIRNVAAQYGWGVVPINTYVSGIARRRRVGKLHIPYPRAFADAIQRNPATEHLLENPKDPVLSTEYLRVHRDTGKVYKGGIFSLDGIHPTTIGYGLMAHLYYETMEEHGVQFQKKLDWDHIIANDTLVTNPPYMLNSLRQLLKVLSMDGSKRLSILGNSILNQLMELLSSRSNRITSSKS